MKNKVVRLEFLPLLGLIFCVQSRKEVAYVPKVELDADEEWELNRRLQILHELTANSRLVRANAVDINVEYYAVCTDSENDAYMIKGQYLTVTGRLIKADPHNQELTLMVDGEKKVVRFSDIYQITDPNDELFDINNRRNKR